jgi:hypothetical protein
MFRISTALFTFTALATLFASGSAYAEVQYPWCAEYRNRIGATNCGFVTYQQCLETISGVGGICTRNPAYHPPARPRPPRDRSR